MITTGVVLARTGSAYRVHTDGGEVVATLRGKLKHRDDDRVVAGDMVELELHAHGRATIAAVRPRRSVLARRAAGERSPRAHPIAALLSFDGGAACVIAGLDDGCLPAQTAERGTTWPVPVYPFFGVPV